MPPLHGLNQCRRYEPGWDSDKSSKRRPESTHVPFPNPRHCRSGPVPALKKMTSLTTTSALLLRLTATLPPKPPLCPRVARLRLQPRRRALLRCAAVSELAPAASAAYGVLLLGGGAFAYSRSGSKGSVYGGLSGSALMGIAYYLMQSPETKAAGDAIGFGSAFLFACVFGIRLYNSRKLVPSGLLLALSLGALAVFYSAYLQDNV